MLTSLKLYMLELSTCESISSVVVQMLSIPKYESNIYLHT